MKCSECECLVRVKNKLGYNLYYCGYKKYGVLKALCGLYINNEEYRKDNETCKYYKAEKKGRKEMTDQEKAEEYLEPIHRMYSCNNEHYTDEVIIQAYLAGLAEGRKEVTYMKAEEYDQYLDTCRKNIELEKENTELKELIKKYNKSNMICFAADMVYKALNPKSSMDTPNCVYIKMESELENWELKE